MAVALARGSAPFSPSFQFKDSKKSLKTGFRVSCVYSSSDPYSTLRIRHDASESEVKKAFRKLALKYHPDVCRGDSCEIRFLQINEAYNTVINNLREQASISNLKTRYGDYACRSMMQTQTRHDDYYYESNVREPTPWYKMDTSYGNFDYELKSKDESSRGYEEDLCEEWMGF